MNQITFRESNQTSPTRSMSPRRTSGLSPRSPRSPRVVQKIYLDRAHNGRQSPVKKRVISYEGELSEDLLKKINDRFVETEKKLTSASISVVYPIRQTFQSSNKYTQKPQKSPNPYLKVPLVEHRTASHEKQTKSVQTKHKIPQTTYELPKPNAKDYIQRLKIRREQSYDLMRSFEKSRALLNSVIAASKEL